MRRDLLTLPLLVMCVGSPGRAQSVEPFDAYVEPPPHELTVSPNGALRWVRVLGRVRHRGAVRCSAAAPDGTWIATAGEDETLRIWQPGTHRQIGCLEIDPPRALAVDPSGRWLFAESTGGKSRDGTRSTGRLARARRRRA